MTNRDLVCVRFLWWISDMNENQEVERGNDETRGEVKRLVAEFDASGIQRNQFCRTTGSR